MSATETVAEFWTFYRTYARTGVHAASTAALTGFGLLTFVHRGFAVVALAAYALPPVYLYLANDGGRSRAGETDRTARDPGSGDGGTTDRAGSTADWSAADAPTEETLSDVVSTARGAYAVGEGGVVLARRDGEWRRALERGPATDGNALRGVAASRDGRAIWFAGDGGALGRYDVESGRHADHSAPDRQTGTWTDVAVAGPAGGETVLLVNGSGAARRGEYDGEGVAWSAPVKPGSGSSMTGAAFADDAHGYLCDTDATVFETTDGGRSYEAVGVGGANADCRDVAAVAPDRVFVASGNGTLRGYDGTAWTPEHVADAAVLAVDHDGERGIAGADDGRVYERDRDGWSAASAPQSGVLHGVAVGVDGPDVAVGTDGALLER